MSAGGERRDLLQEAKKAAAGDGAGGVSFLKSSLIRRQYRYSDA
jgi:hypothetical protein